MLQTQNQEIATDVKVAPGGTENVDEEIYEGIISEPIVEPQVRLNVNYAHKKQTSILNEIHKPDAT